jgi:exodeoxyribonuclease VIII
MNALTANTQHVMLDLETMATSPDAAITAIGACSFDLEAGTPGHLFYVPVRLSSSVSLGGTMDPKTVIWWTQQDDAAKAHLTDDHAVSLPEALVAFKRFVETLGPRESIAMWGNGAGFDNVILRTAYERVDIDAPWNWQGDRC